MKLLTVVSFLIVCARWSVESFGLLDQIKNLGQPSQSSSSASSVVLTCPPRSKNCIVTTWTAPPKSGNVKAALLKILQSYPTEGQANVDKGGYTIVSTNSPIKVEYTSGIGTFAKLFNGGQPFVDDLIAVVNANTVTIRSSSRIGQSDLGVNEKRLQFLGAKAKALGWDVPAPKY